MFSGGILARVEVLLCFLNVFFVSLIFTQKAQTLGHFYYTDIEGSRSWQLETKDLFCGGVKSMRHSMLE